MKFLVLLACVASSSAKSVFHQTSGDLVPALGWDGKSVQGTFFKTNGALSSLAPVAPVVFVHAPASKAIAGPPPPATVHHANGAVVPADTPQVKAAKAAFHRAGGVISAPISQGPHAIVNYDNGALTPADTPAVQAAKASHFMKVVAAKRAFEKARGNLISAGPVAPVAYAAPAPISQGPPAIVSHANGAITPADTSAVQAAKASHSMKVQAAKSAFRQAGGNLIPTGSVAPVAYAAPAPISQGPPAIVSHANGAITPADTPAVQAAKASHSMKVQAAKSAFQQAGVNLIPTGPVAPLAYGGIVSGFIGGAAQPVAFGGLVAHPNGVVVPAEPADVVAARHAHLRAYVTA